MGNISTEHRPGGARFAFDPAIESRRVQDPPRRGGKGVGRFQPYAWHSGVRGAEHQLFPGQ